MAIIRVLAAGSFLSIMLLQHSPEGSAATRSAMSLVDDAVGHVDPARVLDDASLRKAAEFLEHLNTVTRDGLSCGLAQYSGGTPPDIHPTT